MFRMQNQANGKEQDFPNREALLFGLESEEKRCLQLNMTATFHVFQMDKNEEVLDSMELTIPASEGQDVKDLLDDFGLKKEDKKPFWQRSGKASQAELTPASPSSKPQTGAARVLKGLAWLLPMLLSLASLYLSMQTFQLARTQAQSETKTETVVTNQKADVFSRYVISSYFSQNPHLEDYLSEKLSIEDLKIEKATPVSVLLESQEIKGDTTLVTYVVNIKDADDHVSSKRLTLTVKADKKAKYGYLVIKKPNLTAYP
ncbi:TPA: hypothetical protein ACJRTK_001725 [Streptococcus agalactiae]|nr:hypothetical protein [Streptococcus agalactiae]